MSSRFGFRQHTPQTYKPINQPAPQTHKSNHPLLSNSNPNPIPNSPNTYTKNHQTPKQIPKARPPPPQTEPSHHQNPATNETQLPKRPSRNPATKQTQQAPNLTTKLIQQALKPIIKWIQQTPKKTHHQSRPSIQLHNQTPPPKRHH